LLCARFREQAVFFILCVAGTIRVKRRRLAFAINAVSCGGFTPTAGPPSTSVSAQQPIRVSLSIRAYRCCVVRATNPCQRSKTPVASSTSGAAWRDLHHCLVVGTKCRIGSSLVLNVREESNHAAKDSGRVRNRTVLRLSCCRAPGLEQGHKRQSLGQRWLYHDVRRRRGLGRANPVRMVALNSHIGSEKGRGLLPNAFAAHAKRPTESELSSVLGGAKVLWNKLAAELKRDLKLDDEEWKSSSVKAGWLLVTGFFLASFVLGDKAIAAARKSKLPKRVLRIRDEAKRYPREKPSGSKCVKPRTSTW
jgi:hypothetical protein